MSDAAIDKNILPVKFLHLTVISRHFRKCQTWKHHSLLRNQQAWNRGYTYIHIHTKINTICKIRILIKVLLCTKLTHSYIQTVRQSAIMGQSYSISNITLNNAVPKWSHSTVLLGWAFWCLHWPLQCLQWANGIP